MFDRRRIATPLSHDAGDDAPPTDRNGGGVSILGPRDVPRVRRTLLHLYERGRAAAVYELGETARSGAFAGPGNFVPITLGVSLVTGFVVRPGAGAMRFSTSDRTSCPPPDRAFSWRADNCGTE